jgi:hypothetical protein
VEQEYGEPNSATSLAARTVLPGEPFNPPASSAVPGPRDLPVEPPAPEPEPQWTFGGAQRDLAQPPRSFEPASYDPTYGDPATADPHHPPAAYGESYSPTYATADSLTAPDQFESLHEFGALPVAQSADTAFQFPAPQAAPAYPPAYDTTAPPAYPAPDVSAAYPPPAAPAYPAPTAPPSWPAPMQEPMPTYEAFDDAAGHAPTAPPAIDGEEPPAGEDSEGAHRKSQRPSRSLLILAAVAVLGGAGYFGYTQLHKSDSNSASTGNTVVVPPKAKTPATTNTTPVTPVTPTTGGTAYAYPAQLAGFSVRTSSAATLLKSQITSFSKTAYPAAMGSAQVASYGNGVHPAVVAVTFHPAASQLTGGFNAILAGVQKPATGNTVGAFTSVPAGAAGGSMTCGSQTGASPMSICVWKGKTAVGEVYLPGSTATANTQALTREMRAAAEG